MANELESHIEALTSINRRVLQIAATARLVSEAKDMHPLTGMAVRGISDSLTEVGSQLDAVISRNDG